MWKRRFVSGFSLRASTIQTDKLNIGRPTGMGQAVSATKHMTGTNRPRAVLVHAPVDERLERLVARESIDGTTVVPEIPSCTFTNMYISITVWDTVRASHVLHTAACEPGKSALYERALGKADGAPRSDTRIR